jgi:hypothetical protein
MRLNKIIGWTGGLICIAVGIYLIISANSSMDTVGESIKKEISGDYSEHTRNYMIGGIVLIILGGSFLLYARTRKK